ncbi:MAG: TIGR00730 family Rossman fold protein [Planctomycetota bacterium]|nr:TIGR00730 family Rossman fold protein [Planctomycetota bacterium]
MKAVCVFCGSSFGRRLAYAAAARELGRVLVQRDITLVWGGGNVGLMGVVADAVLEHGGRAIGVIPRGLEERELSHRGATEVHVTASMHERKALMERLSDAFIALPGGFGTLDELCEILTWRQLGLHTKPIGLLDVERFFDPLVASFDHAVAEGFVREEQRSMLIRDDDAERLLTRLASQRT